MAVHYDDPKWIGQKFGTLTVLECIPHTTSSGVKNGFYWRMKCDCGNIVDRVPNQTVLADWPSCGCQRGIKLSKYLDESWIGKKFGRLTVEKAFRTRDKNGRALIKWTLRCDCGNEVTIAPSKAVNGVQESCGCLAREMLAKRSRKHGESHTRLFYIWACMRNRCYRSSDTRYANYGGRGIRVCDEWNNDYATFAKWARENGYRDDLTIDRIDVNGDYTPENCRWATWEEQANNKTNNRRVTIDGVTKTLAEWCREYDIDYRVVHTRITNLKWDAVKAIITPNGGSGSNQTTFHPERKKKPVIRKYHVKHHNVVVDGEEMSLRAACLKLGLPYQAMHLRVTRYGMTAQAAIEKPYVDKSQSLKEKCRKHNMPYGAVVARIKAGWSEERALSEPINRKKGHRRAAADANLSI